MKSGTVIVGKYIFESLLALTEEEQQLGLMYRKWEPPIMAFPYKQSSVNKFWMKNTPSPLDIIFSNKGKIVHIASGEPYSTKLIGGNEPSDLIVEMPSGYVNKYDIRLGQQIKLVD